MKNLFRVVCAIFITALWTVPFCAHAQKVRAVKPVTKALSSSRLSRTVLQAAKRPDIRLSVARLDHAILLDVPINKRPHSTAFLFSTTYKGKKEVWAVTARHTAQLGEKLLLTFYDGKKSIPIYGTLVQQGPVLLSDASLIKLDNPPLEKLHPFELTTQINPHEKLATWGYASNKLYQVNNLTFEKDNTRFLRTDFPPEQKKRSGLCGGPLLNAQGQAVGIHCGSTMEDKAYAASVRIIPYLLQAYHEGNAQIPIIAHGINFGSINLDERIMYIQCMNEHGEMINQEDFYDQLPQSLLMTLYQDPEVRYLRFVLGSLDNEEPVFRVLVYDKKTQTSTFEPLHRNQNLFE